MALVPIERQVNVATVAARLRQQMGLKDAATKEASEFATAAEGLLATTALQPESPLAAENLTGTIDPARIPVLPGNEQIVSSAGIAALTTEQQAVVLRGSIVTTTDGRRWVYTGSGSKVSEASYIVLADVTPEWSAVSGKPTFGDAAAKNTGTTAGTVAAGDDERIQLGETSVQTRATKNDIAALDPAVTKSAALSDDDVFYWSSADLSDWVDRDPTRSVLVPPYTDTSGASGAWVRKGPWQLGTVYATWFGVRADSDGTAGNGTDNAAAIQAAIDFVAPFVWKGTTRLTELQGSTSGTVIFQKGIIRFGSKIKLAPNLTLRGQGCGNDWAVRTGIGGDASGTERMGTALFADIIDHSTYALDTCPYDNTGTRLDDATQLGGDSTSGLRTQVSNVRFRELTIYGNWTCKGINLAGAESCDVEPGVLIRGFTVGVRLTAAWYAKQKARILYSWRGMITWMAATDVDISGASFWRPVEAPVYDPAVSGWDGTEPTVDAWWTTDVLKRSAAIFNYYGNVVGTNVAVELGDYQFMSKNGVADIRGIYTEQTQHGVIFTEGPDQQNERYSFDTITTSTAPLLFSKNARVFIEALHHNYSQDGFGRVIGDLFNTLGDEAIPVLNGVMLKAGDAPFGDSHISYSGLREFHGAWSPELRFGGAPGGDGTGSVAGRWVRIGNIVFVQGIISIGSLTAATGAATIEGLPFRIRNYFGLDACAEIAFYYGTPTLRVGRGEAGGYSIIFDGVTNVGFTNDAEIRFQMRYETDERGPWGW